MVYDILNLCRFVAISHKCIEKVLFHQWGIQIKSKFRTLASWRTEKTNTVRNTALLTPSIFLLDDKLMWGVNPSRYVLCCNAVIFFEKYILKNLPFGHDNLCQQWHCQPRDWRKKIIQYLYSYLLTSYSTFGSYKILSPTFRAVELLIVAQHSELQNHFDQFWPTSEMDLWWKCWVLQLTKLKAFLLIHSINKTTL